jgi:two-component system, NtrC family, response regulator GlrR
VPIRLEAFVDGRKVASLTIERGGASVGSAPGNNLVIDHPTVSRKHIELHVRPSSVFVRDLDSKNGTRYQGSQVHEVQVPVGASLLLGEAELRVEDASAPEPARFGGMASVAPAMKEVLDQLSRAAQTDSTVLIEGETGVGKEFAARALHEASARRGGAFVVVDCSVLPWDAGAELFGQAPGGAAGVGRPGVFQTAQDGTLFLDGVSSIPLDQQPFITRALERRSIRRVGSTSYEPINVRVVASGKGDLTVDVRKGQLSAELFHCLTVVRVRIPPLRERPEDIPMLIRAILETFGPRAAGFTLPPDTAAKLAAYSWPGNVRELRTVIERTVTLAAEGPIDSKMLEAATGEAGTLLDYHAARDRALLPFERDYLLFLLRQSGNNITQAAKLAGIDRGYIHRLMKKHGLTTKDL